MTVGPPERRPTGAFPGGADEDGGLEDIGAALKYDEILKRLELARVQWQEFG